MGRTSLEYTTSLEDWILLERRIARLAYKETECGYLPVVLLFCMQSKCKYLCCSLTILLLQGQTSQDRVTGKKQTFMENRAGLLEFAGIHSELHISLNLY